MPSRARDEVSGIVRIIVWARINWKNCPGRDGRSKRGSGVKWQFNTPDDSLLLHSKLWKMWNYFNGRWWRCCCSYFFLLFIPSCSAHASAAAEDNKVVINCDYNYRVYGVFNHSIGEEGAVRLRLNQVNPNCVEHRSSLSWESELEVNKRVENLLKHRAWH